MSISSLSISRPVTTLMFFIGISILGVIAFTNLSVDFLPEVKIPKLTIQTSYPNVSPEEVETRITQPLESSLGTVSGVKKVSSVSREGMSIINIEFFWGVNMDYVLLDVREKLDQTRNWLPKESGRPTILRVDPAKEPIMVVALTDLSVNIGTQKSGLVNASQLEVERLVRLKETARALVKRRIEQVEGVAQASVLGGLEREIHVYVDNKKLQALGFSIDQVSSALSSANINLPGGTIKRGLFRYSLRTLGEFTKAEEIRDVIIGKTLSGRSIKISDIGNVEDGFKERIGLTRYNGKEVIAIHIRKEAGANTIVTSEKIHNVLKILQKENPHLRTDVIADQAEFISKSISDVKQAIIIGTILVFLVLFFFLRKPKYPIIIGLAMPISILATCVAMYFFHISINIISLTGLALGIGMLGDNAIMVVENATRLQEKGMGVLQAAIEGASEINLAVTASTLTNVAIFLPIIFVEGVASQLFIDMGVTMTISLLVSLLVAATLVPMLVSREYKYSAPKSVSMHDYFEKIYLRRKSKLARLCFWALFPFRFIYILIVTVYVYLIGILKNIAGFFAPSFYKVVDIVAVSSYSKLDEFLTWAIEKRFTVLASTLIVFLLCVGIAFLIPSEPAPDIDQSRFRITVQMPKGASLEGTSKMASMLEQNISQMKNIKGVYSSVGVTEEQNLWTVSEASTERAELEIQVSSESYTSDVINEVRSKLTQILNSMSGVEFAVKRRGTTFEQILRPETEDVKIRVIGKDPQMAFNIAERFAEHVKHVQGLVDLRTSLQRGSPEYKIIIDREQASRYGLSVQQVSQHISSQTAGKEATFLSDFDRKITIRVQPFENQRKTIDDILSSTILVQDNAVPVRELVSVIQQDGFAEVWRENQQRAVIMVANVSGTSVANVVEAINKEIKSFSIPPGYSISIGGENEQIQESFKSLFIVILLSLFLVYMILAAEYESILYPFVVLLTSPLAFIGAILAMIISGQHYNVMSLIGLVIMIGAVDNDAVIVVDIITSLRRQGVSLKDAIKTGMQLRMRPILMTTVTTVLGVIPLVVEFGTGSELVRALTIPLVGGLLASTFFTIVAIPIVYTYIDKWAIGKE